ERGLRRGVVRRLGGGHALDRALAEARRVLRELLLERVGGERSEHRPAAWKNAERRAQDGSANHRPVGLLDVLPIGPEAVEGLCEHLAVLSLLEVADD